MWLPRMEPGLAQCTALLDIQSLLSESEFPILMEADFDVSPKSDPYSRTSTDPVDAAFAPIMDDKAERWKEIISVRLLEVLPAVMETL